MAKSYVYNPRNTSFAKRLRRNQTDTERFLWTKLRRKQINNLKFHRQYPIGSYIVDFYCPDKKLVIELDGSQHFGQIEYDDKRTRYLERLGITVLSFWDNEVFKNTNGVLEKIYQLCS